MVKEQQISYSSKNGYTGIMYGESSLIIKDNEGIIVLQTGFRNINTKKELKRMVDNYPTFLSLAKSME